MLPLPAPPPPALPPACRAPRVFLAAASPASRRAQAFRPATPTRHPASSPPALPSSPPPPRPSPPRARHTLRSLRPVPPCSIFPSGDDGAPHELLCNVDHTGSAVFRRCTATANRSSSLRPLFCPSKAPGRGARARSHIRPSPPPQDTHGQTPGRPESVHIYKQHAAGPSQRLWPRYIGQLCRQRGRVPWQSFSHLTFDEPWRCDLKT
jgi:hypothetical protein